MVAARTAGHVELRSQAAALLRDARAGGLTRARITDLRRLGERMGWAEEGLMVRLTGGGTRPWSAAEMSELLTTPGQRIHAASHQHREREPMAGG